MAHQSVRVVPNPSTYPNPPRSEWVNMQTPGAEPWMIGFNEMAGIPLFKAYDQREMLQRISRIAIDLGEICVRGDLELLRAEMDKIRATDEFFINRPLAWVWLSSQPNTLKSAYEMGHWHIIEYLVRDLGFDPTPPLRVEWDLPTAAADRSLETNSTEELQRLLDLGWDINSWMGHSPYNIWGFGGLPTISRVCINEPLLRWHLSHGATPYPGVMITAVRVAPLPILKALVQHGGKLEGTNLVAQAALADLWGYPDRIEVIDYLLNMGAPLDSTATFESPPVNPQYLLKKSIDYFSGSETAYNIARISGNRNLESLLLARGADANSDVV